MYKPRSIKKNWHIRGVRFELVS